MANKSQTLCALPEETGSSASDLSADLAFSWTLAAQKWQQQPCSPSQFDFCWELLLNTVHSLNTSIQTCLFSNLEESIQRCLFQKLHNQAIHTLFTFLPNQITLYNLRKWEISTTNKFYAMTPYFITMPFLGGADKNYMINRQIK